jgi:hypothetical protein
MTPNLEPSVICTAPDRCRAEVRLLADGESTLIYCSLASCRETAISRVARFVRQLRAACGNLPLEEVRER